MRSDVVDNSYDCLPPVDSTMVPIAWMEHPVVNLSISIFFANDEYVMSNNNR